MLSQDGNQRKRNVWLVNKYDILGRLLYVSEVEEAGDVASIRKSFSGWLVTESFSTTPHQYPQEDTGYSKGFYHQAPTTLLTVYYYDDYQFLELMPEKEIYLMYDPHWDKEGKKWDNAKGLLTGKRTYALDGSGNYTAMAYYYDAHGNIIQELSTNHLDGGDNHYYTYTFTGKVLKDVHEHSKDQTSFLDICTNTYDHAERLTSTTYNVFAKTITTNYSYDNLGRMKQKNINNIETIQYKYNIRNWLTDIISPNFTEKMYYANIGRCYNGNISRIDWKVGNEDITRNYLFKYDGLNRLTFADYAYCTSSLCANANSFDVKVESYDKQGNILQLSRYGRITPQQAQRIQSRIVNDDETPPADPYGIIDNLNYTYNGNQLKSVSDVSDNDPVYKDVMHFVDGADTDVEYTYDANGNMTSDRNKKIESIAYNNLNLPVLVSMERKSTIFNPGIALFPYTQNHIRYDYDAEGKKLRVSYGHSEGSMQRSGGVNMSIVYSGYTDYCDNFVYENDTLVKILLSEGYIACKDRTFHFYLKDHQGNNRVVANESGGIEQVNHYYPFGGLFGESSGGDVQKYKYGGKELERMHGVDLYDFSARMQDPVLGRFNTMDPMCEKYYSISPYAYCNNNPIMYIDPNGMDIVIWYQNERGKQVNFIFNGQNENNAPRNKFVNSVISAYNYNIKNGGGNNLKVIVTNAKIKIEIVETDKDNKYVSNNKGLIRFNPNAGLKLDDGNILSPATGLEHEAAHAVNDKFDKQNEKYDSKYGTKEEKNVIKGAELETARANGELPINHQGRESHSEGKWVVTKSVISNKEIDEKRSRELRKKIKDFKNNWTSE